MASAPLKTYSIDQLLSLRSDVERRLAQLRGELERQLSRLAPAKRAGRPPKGRRGSSLRGIKVAPKFRGPNGETWAGRGAQPRWLTALIKEGHKREEYAVGRARAAVKTKARRKSARKKR